MSFILAYVFSLSLMGTFSATTENNFITSCSVGSDKALCSCVLNKLEQNYSEEDFKKWESKILKGEKASEYIDFLVKAKKDCESLSLPAGSASGALIASAGKNQTKAVPQPTAPAKAETATAKVPSVSGAPSTAVQTPVFNLSPADMQLLKIVLSNKQFRKSFADECVDEAEDYLGKKDAKRSCDCAFNRLTSSDSLVHLLMNAFDDSGKADDFERWGFEIIAPCLPQNFTPEMEKAFMKECSEDASKKACSCAYGEITRKYTVQGLIKEAFQNQKKFELEMLDIIGKCSQ
ncbi:MAG: hypothetical protein HUK21_07460 [Fibrobacteraceae bacterium]|nr:hypothetical protein [Fibrobacteraceae bacterium]